MKLSRLMQLLVALFLATGLFVGSIQFSTAHAASGPCASLIPNGSYTSGFGNTLATPTIRGSVIPVCNNGYNGYFSHTWDSYGLTFQCVELANRYAAIVFGDSVSAWGGDADLHWSQHPSDWYQRPDGGNSLQQVGDLIVWGPVDQYGNPAPNPNGYPGHIAIITSISRVNLTTWNVVAANQNFSNGPMTAWSYGTITRTSGDGLYWYSLLMHQGATGSQLYGVLHHN